MERMNGETLNIVEDNIQKLKAIFPEVFNEDKVDFEKLEAVLGEYKDNGTERYNFSWPGKAKAIRIAQTPSTGTLRPCKEESKNWDETQNLYIEGDNLEVLKLLQKSYYGKVKMIYIDPPYNTGNDFVYKDDFKDNIENYLSVTGQKDEEGKKTTTNTESNGRYHSNWLNMMYPRLKLARNLLRDDGVIFISIDDKEIFNLKKICDDIFGENCFLGNVARATGTTTGQDSGGFGSSFDYILVYSKDVDFELGGIPLEENDLSRFNMEDGKGKFSILQLRKTGNADRREDRPNMYYPVLSPDGTKVLPIGPGGYDSRWRVGKDSYNKLVEEDMIFWKNTDDRGWIPYVKYYLEGRLKRPSTLWNDIEGNKKASLQLKELIGAKVFDNPKPLELIRRILQISNCNENGDIVLDFFSGSGTTANAILQSNFEDNINRKFIMVQIPEKCNVNSEAYKAGFNNICELAKVRISRAGEKIDSGLGYHDEFDNGFKVFKLDSSNINKWDLKDGEDIERKLYEMTENIKEGRTEEDILYEILLKYGIDLNMPIEEHNVCGKKVFDIGFGAIIACLDSNITLDVVEGIGKLKEELSPEENECRVVFMDNGFATDSVKTNAIQILKRYNIEDVKSI